MNKKAKQINYERKEEGKRDKNVKQKHLKRSKSDANK